MDRKVLAKNGRKYISEAMQNSKQFLKDAEVLIDSGSFAHGAAFAVLAIEESVKAKVATNYVGHDRMLRVDSGTYEEEIKNHFGKLSEAAKDYWITSVLYKLIPEGRTGSCSLKELHERTKKLAEDTDEEKRLMEEVESYLYACLSVLKLKVVICRC